MLLEGLLCGLGAILGSYMGCRLGNMRAIYQFRKHVQKLEEFYRVKLENDMKEIRESYKEKFKLQNEARNEKC